MHNSSIVCIKCKGENGPPAVYVRKDDPALCKTCFLTACMHKFRSAFGKHNAIRNGEKVVLAYSGGISSSAMMQLAKQCLDHSEFKKVRFQPFVVCIYDPNQPYPFEKEATIKKTGFEYKLYSSDELPVPETGSEVVGSRLNSSALTASEEMLRWRRTTQLVLCTRQLGLKYLLLGDSASQLAAHCLAGVAQGRGQSVGSELDFSDVRFDDVLLLRPMYNFLANELTLFLHFSGLMPYRQPTATVEQTLLRGPGVNSIQRLTEDFISSLQFAGFPSTTKAVLSAASKTLTKGGEVSQRCLVCRAPLDTFFNSSPEDLTALAAIEHSSWISHSKEEEYPGPSSLPNNNLQLCPCCAFNQTELARANV